MGATFIQSLEIISIIATETWRVFITHPALKCLSLPHIHSLPLIHAVWCKLIEDASGCDKWICSRKHTNVEWFVESLHSSRLKYCRVSQDDFIFTIKQYSYIFRGSLVEMASLQNLLSSIINERYESTLRPHRRWLMEWKFFRFLINQGIK